MKKWIAYMLAAATLLLCGCGAQPAPAETTAPQVQQTMPPETTEPTAAPELQTVDLNLWILEDSLWTDEEALSAMLEEFNAYYPNIILHMEHVSADQLGETLPDLLLGNVRELDALRENVAMADTTALWSTLDADIYAPLAAACGDDNGYFSLPLCAVPYCMAINLEQFENAQSVSLLNLTNHTWTTGNFLKAGVNLYDSGLENALSIYCMDTQGDVYTRLLMENLYGGSYVNTINGSYAADSDAMVKAVVALREGLGFKYRSDVTAEISLEQFLNGETPMVLNWSSALQLEHWENEDIFFMLYPSGGKSKTYADVYGLSILASGDTTKEAASMTFAAYAARSDAAVRATGQLPARISAAEAYAGTELEEIMAELAKLLSHVTEGEIPGKCWEDGRQQWVTMLQNISRGTNVAYCADICQRAMEKILANAENS